MKSKAERINKNCVFFKELVIHHPDLPILPLVDSDVVYEGGYFGSYFGEITAATIEKVYFGDDNYYFKKDEEYERVITDAIGEDAYDEVAGDREKERELYESLQWVEVIVVFINPPEVDWR